MKDGGRLAAAIEVLADIERTHRPVQEVLKDWGVKHRFAGSRDRNAVGNLVFDVMRRRLSLAARMGDDSPRAVVLAAYVHLWGRGLPALDAALADDRHAPAVLTEGERSALEATEDPAALAPHVAGDLPGWLAPSLTRAFGDRLVEEGIALAARAEVDLRANILKADRAALIAALSDFGARETPWSPVGIRLAGTHGDEKPQHVGSELAYKKGQFEIQDEGSQIAALMAADGTPGQMLDFCAGAGGKALAIAAAYGNRGQIFAHDSDKRRFGDILERIARAGAHNIQIREPRRQGSALDDLKARMDVVLVDAPCTGSGTWRRRPDAKWRLAAGALEMRQREQRTVLDDSAALVRPGGRLVYVTCSVLPEENEDQMAAFLARHPDFGLADAGAVFHRVTGKAAPDVARLAIEGAGEGGAALRLTPATTGTDGFFVAVAERRAA